MTAPEPQTPFEMGQQAAREAITRGEVPSREALDKVAAIIAASQGRQAAGPAEQQPGAAA